MRKINLNIKVAVWVFLMTLTGPAGADTHYVSPGQSIQAAINAASNGDEICVLSGTYTEAINFNGKAVRLYSSGGPDVTTIDAGLLLLENFNDGNYDGWEIVDQGNSQGPSAWSAETGEMVQSSNIYTEPKTDPKMLGTYAWWKGGTSWKDYEVFLTMKSNDDDAMGVMFGYHDPNNYFRFAWLSQDHSQGIGRLQLGKFVGGVFTVMYHHKDVPYVPGQEYQVQIKVSGNIWTVLIDGATVMSGTDTDLAGGSIALYCWGNEGTYFDNIEVKGRPAYHVVQCVSGEGANTILEGFTITGGEADRSSWPDNVGGGMLNIGSSPTVTNCTFSGNSAVDGGGMSNQGSSPKVTNCIFTGNSADDNGGGMLNGQSSPKVTNCTFSGNWAANYGSGMYNAGSNPTVTNCSFTGNVSEAYGGGMCNDQSSPTIIDCTFTANSATSGAGGGMFNYSSSTPMVTNCNFSGNSAMDGGGMYNNYSEPNVTNCIFSGNTATGHGGGMANYKSSPTLTNCTFCGNLANAIGGGILNYDSCNPVVTNCILWGNSPSQIVDWPGTSCSTTVTYSDVQDGWSGAGSNNIAADPLFVDAIAGNLRLSSGSPCIDKGSNAGVPPGITTDLDGNPRISDGDKDGIAVVDMGAYEYIETLRLVAHWKLDEYYGPTAHDSAGENHGTLYGGPFWLPTWGKVGGALQLDGVDDYVDCGNDDSLNITGQITLALWVNTNDSGNGQYNSYITKGDHSYGLQHKYNNNVEFFFSDGVNWYWVWYPIDSSFNGVWHHLAGTYDGSQLKLYVDGELKAGSSHTGSIGSSTYNVNIGRNSEATDRLYNGLIDDVRIYNYALSANEILQLLCTRQINGDLDGNCKVDFRDLALLVSEWLSCNLPSYELCWE